MADLTVGFAAALEQFSPAEILEHVVLAEQHGFSGVMAADHFQPWVPAQGQASFVWNVMTAIAERTAGDIGPGVTAPTFRWHPALVAQASATLAAMYPGRHWLGLGSGEALNEHILGTYWPEVPVRINRMFEAIEIINKLFAGSLAGKDVKHAGEYYTLESTRLWTMPETPPEIYVATAGPVTAKRAGSARRRADHRGRARWRRSAACSPSSTRARARPARTRRPCRDCSRSTCPGRRPTSRPWPTRWTSGPTAA